MKKDFFISYDGKDKELVDSIVNNLENRGASCWIAPRDATGRYAEALVNGIKNTRMFVLFLSNNSATSDHVLNEIEIAYKYKKNKNDKLFIQPVCLEKLNIDSEEFDEIMYYIRRMNFIDTLSYDSNIISNEIISKFKELFNEEQFSKKNRDNLAYYLTLDEKERVVFQRELTLDIDRDILKNLYIDKKHINVLDVGSGTGERIVNCLSDINKEYKLIGIEKEADNVEEAIRRYSSENIKFLHLSVSEDFTEDLLDLMDEMSIESFDVITISMVLPYIKDMYRLLKKLHRLLSGEGYIVIKDIDDGLNMAYPDDDNLLDVAYDIYENSIYSGERRNARQIPTNLMRAGYSMIDLQKQGLSTLNMSKEEKEKLFYMYFGAILTEIKRMYKEYPNNEEIVERYHWYNENLEKIHSKFKDEEFFFSIGFMWYIARK